MVPYSAIDDAAVRRRTGPRHAERAGGQSARLRGAHRNPPEWTAPTPDITAMQRCVHRLTGGAAAPRSAAAGTSPDRFSAVVRQERASCLTGVDRGCVWTARTRFLPAPAGSDAAWERTVDGSRW